MFKWLMLGLLGLLVFVIIILRFMVLQPHFDKMAIASPSPILSDETPTSTAGGLLKTQVDSVLNKVNQPLGKEAGPSATTKKDADRINALEVSVTDLRQQIKQLQTIVSQTQNSTTSTTRPPVYIPIGSGGSTTSLDWATVTEQQIEIDPADYPGYRAMYLIVQLRIFQGNGKAYARLINITDNTPIYNSEVSTTNANYMDITSPYTFSLASGKKVYRLQLKSSSSYDASVQFAKIKVVY